jgi:hypothetical protein
MAARSESLAVVNDLVPTARARSLLTPAYLVCLLDVEGGGVTMWRAEE